jgi:hypothetical protein
MRGRPRPSRSRPPMPPGCGGDEARPGVRRDPVSLSCLDVSRGTRVVRDSLTAGRVQRAACLGARRHVPGRDVRCWRTHARRRTRAAPWLLPKPSSLGERPPPDEITSPDSAQIHLSSPANLQATALHPSEPRPSDKSQVTDKGFQALSGEACPRTAPRSNSRPHVTALSAKRDNSVGRSVRLKRWSHRFLRARRCWRRSCSD